MWVGLVCLGMGVLWIGRISLLKWNKYMIRTKNFPELLFALASTGGFFTAFLNIHNCIIGPVKVGKGNFQFCCLIARHLSTSQGLLDLGGILALVDEISTVLLCCEDKTHRPGVSVSLTGEILRPEGLKAGDVVWIESVVSKVGSVLGFAEVIFWKTSEKREILARASHIKYMPVGGKIWDLASPLMPSLVVMAHRFGWSGAPLQEKEYLPLAKLLDVQSSSIKQSDSHFELISHHKIQNHMKYLHGGALSMAITDAVTQFHVKFQKKIGGKQVCPQSLRWMEMQYLAPCKGKISISIVPQASTKNGNLPPNNSLEHIHSFRIEVYSTKKNAEDSCRCLAHGSVLFY